MSATESLPEHQQRPHLRQIQPLPARTNDGKDVVFLRDPLQLDQRPFLVAPQALPVIQQFQGSRTVDEIAEQFNAPPEKVLELVTMLDDHGLLWGPVSEEREVALKAKIAEIGRMPPGAAYVMQKEADEIRAQFDAWLAEVEDPELEVAPRAIVAPHLDYDRGWPIYAASYRCLEGVEKPDRVVILGTNHFGVGDGVVLTEWGFSSPLGDVNLDVEVIAKLRERLGDGAFIDQLDHLPEHSIALHLPWIQHRFGDVPVVAALIPNPLTPMIDDDGKRASRAEFVATLREALASAGGTTLFIASSDLSHVGPQFGEPAPVDDQRREDVERQDREMLGAFIAGDPGAFVEKVEWAKNPTRWCSVGNMTALLELLDGEDVDVELIDYKQAVDERGLTMVTAASLAVLPSAG